MTRNQIFTTIEFINDTIRMVLGEYYNDKFYVYDVFESKCSGLLNGEIVDQKIVSDTIKQIRDDINLKHDILIEDVILSLPSNKLIISTFTSSSPVTGKNSLISEYDISEAYKVASKVRHDENQTIVSVVPVEYYLDNGEKMDFAPIRYRSNTFKTLFNVLLLPNEIFNAYMSIVTSCNLKILNYFIDGECLYTGLFDEGNINCAIVNLNRFNSTMTIFKTGKLLAHYTTNKGSLDIETKVMNTYDVKESDLDRVVYTLASANLSTSNRRAIYKNENYELYKYLNQYQLDEIANGVYDEIFKDLLAKSSNVFDTNTYDVYLAGKGSNIKDVDKLFTSISGCNSTIISPNYLCLNNPSFLQTVGLIRLNYRKLMETKVVIETSPIMVETKESKFDKFILDEDELK